MAKDLLGIDIGYDRMKLAWVSGGQVKKTVSVPMPEKLLKEGRVVSIETMGEMLRNTVKEQGIKCKNAAIVLSGETVFIRNVTMPQMNEEQLRYNLPYEFRDYITEELKDYIFDYAMISTPEELKAAGKTDAPDAPGSRIMELMAVAVRSELIGELTEMVRKGGLRLTKAAPGISAYTALIRRHPQLMQGGECCILDLGYEAIRMYIFKGDCHMVTRELEGGMARIDEVIADQLNVDVHLAHTYALANYEGCMDLPAVQMAMERIGIDLMRAFNFYAFNNPDSVLSDIYLCGGGAAVRQLRTAIGQNISMTIHEAAELLPQGAAGEESYSFVQAIGITMD